jgi:hypothetical protein
MAAATHPGVVDARLRGHDAVVAEVASSQSYRLMMRDTRTHAILKVEAARDVALARSGPRT